MRHTVATTLSLVFVTAAAAQRPTGYLPKPLTATAIEQYCDAMTLSAAQRHAVESLLPDYWAQYRGILEDEADVEQPGLGVEFSFAPRSFWVNQHESNERIGNLEERLFDSVQSFLSDSQIPLLPRVRQMRFRERLIGAKVFWGVPPPFDLSHSLLRLSLPDEHIRAVEPIMIGYEVALTGKLQAYVQSQIDSLMRQYDHLARLGFTDKRILDPADRDALGDALEEAVGDEARVAAPRRYADAVEILDLNRRTLAALKGALPSTEWRWLNAEFLQATYPRIKGAIPVESPFDVALVELGHLGDTQRAVLQEEAGRFNDEVDSRIARLTERIDAHWAKYEPDVDATDQADAEQAMKAETRAFKVAMDQMHTEAEKRVEVILRAPNEAPHDAPHEPGLLDFDTNEDIAESALNAALLLPAPLGQKEFAECSLRLALDDSQRALLREAQQSYRSKVATYEVTRRQIAGPQYGDVNLTPEIVRRFEESRRAAVSALQAIDEEFFATVQRLLNLSADDSRLVRLRLARERQYWNAGVYGALRRNTRAPGGAMESLIDVSSLVFRLAGSAAISPVVDRIVDEYEQTVSPTMKSRYDLILRAQADELAATAEWARLRASEAAGEEELDGIEKRFNIEGTRRAAMAVNREIAALNRATMERLGKALSHEEAGRLVDVYERLCWPRILIVAFDGASMITRVLALHDLTQQQRTDIEGIAAAYHPAYRDLCSKMIDAVEKPDSTVYAWVWSSEKDRAEAVRRARARSLLLTERHELNVRAWQRLRRILTPDQAKRASLPAIPPSAIDANADFGA